MSMLECWCTTGLCKNKNRVLEGITCQENPDGEKLFFEPLNTVWSLV